ncbi:MAG: urate hydroxylase PuuD [Pseudomonadota bacterium]|nr:urate hydroxylase PuuD [Pseudomonadota bacterium]
MDAYLADWAHLILRWLHLIAGAAWIGASFYFNWLNNHVRPPEDGRKGIEGEVWSVHGGAFYQAIKHGYTLPKLPGTLHWFYWEAYTTWLSGIGLLAVVYWLDAKAWMAGPYGPGPAVAVGIGGLVVGWIVYDLLCKSPLAPHPRAFGLTVYALLVAAAFGLYQVLPARAAYIHTGAIIGTIMAANVFFVIIPSQRTMVDKVARGEPPDLTAGKPGAVRSLHNNYFTLPVLFIMVSNHFPFTYGSDHGWLALAAIGAVGVVIRHVFNLKGKGVAYTPWIPVAVVGGLVIIAAMAPKRIEGPAVGWSEVAPIVSARCTPCHATAPTMAGFTAPPKGYVLETEAHAAVSAALIRTQVETQVMPLGNLTGMTPEERAKLVAWAAGMSDSAVSKGP